MACMILYDIIFKGFKAFKGFKYNLKDKSFKETVSLKKADYNYMLIDNNSI